MPNMEKLVNKLLLGLILKDFVTVRFDGVHFDFYFVFLYIEISPERHLLRISIRSWLPWNLEFSEIVYFITLFY